MMKYRGFTLLEIMVVISIMAIIMASVSFIGRDSRWMQVEDTAQNIVEQLAIAQDHSLLSQQEFGIYFYQQGFVWVKNQPQIDPDSGEELKDADDNTLYSWQILPNDTQIQAFELDQQWALSLTIADSEIELAEQLIDEADVNADIGLREFSEGEIFVDSFNGTQEEQGMLPHLIFYLSGEISEAYTLTVKEDSQQFTQPYAYSIISDGFNPSQINATDLENLR